MSTDNGEAAENLAKLKNLPTSLETLVADMPRWKAVPLINYLVESNPSLNLRNIPKLPPLEMVKALLSMMMTNDRLLSGFVHPT